MARGRIINNEIIKDKRVNNLSDDTSRLAFTWLITLADCEGRTNGDPALLRSMLFPRRTDITVEQMEQYIIEWHNAGLANWYEAEDDLWISLPNFDKHQVGLRKDREPKTNIPSPDDGTPPVNIRQLSGKQPEDYGLKDIKLKDIKRRSSPDGDKPPENKSKPEFVIAMETLEGVFAKARGCPLPDWEHDPKTANKRWRTPLGHIFNQCDKDIQKASTVIRDVVTAMRKDNLTFDAPDQILKTAASRILDNNGTSPASKATVEW